jgi:predicted HicB family RNase H-like nuclease
VIEYKGYEASVEQDEGKLFIRVLDITDLLVTECSGAPEVMPAFIDVIDDYLETCKELGEEPKKPMKPDS